jgi:hypothetical protein
MLLANFPGFSWRKLNWIKPEEADQVSEFLVHEAGTRKDIFAMMFNETLSWKSSSIFPNQTR